MSGVRIKPSSKAAADFDFLLKTPLDMIGDAVGVEERDCPDGHSALECWYARDTLGKMLPCRELGKLRKVERSKQSWNLQIKMWAEALNDPLVLSVPELRDYCEGLPEWIFAATLRQAQKICRETIGFVRKGLS